MTPWHALAPLLWVATLVAIALSDRLADTGAAIVRVVAKLARRRNFPRARARYRSRS